MIFYMIVVTDSLAYRNRFDEWKTSPGNRKGCPCEVKENYETPKDNCSDSPCGCQAVTADSLAY